MSPETRALALAGLLLAGGCARERATADTSALAGIPERSIVPAPPVDSIDRYARHLDSLAFTQQLRVVAHEIGKGDPDATVWGYYSGDALVVARGVTGDATLPRYLRVYFRGGSPVLFALAPDASSQRSATPSAVARWYMNADTVIATSGRATPAQLPALRSVLAFFSKVLTEPGRTIDSVATDTLVARPHAPYVVHGACPFECCHYGDWTIESGARLRREPAATAPVVATLDSGAAARADSGLVRLETLGLVVVDRRVTDQDTGIDFAAGDSLLLLDYVGEGFTNAWLRGHRFQSSTFWDSTGASGARLVRGPVSRWWVHLTRIADADTLRGWVDMSDEGVQVSGADACGGG